MLDGWGDETKRRPTLGKVPNCFDSYLLASSSAVSYSAPPSLRTPGMADPERGFFWAW